MTGASSVTSILTARLKHHGRARPQRREIPRDAFWAHSYFTDGVKLYRFVGWVSDSVNAALAAFEDCMSLDILLVRVDEFGVRGLSPLLPAC